MNSETNHLYSIMFVSACALHMLSDIASLQVIACLDVRANDEGDLVVTKGDQYDVREHADQSKV
jgi:hypothetical protein